MERRSCVAGTVLIGLLSLGILVPNVADALDTFRVASGLNRPIQVTAPEGDPRLFIVEQRGVIKILKDGQVLGTPFLDIDAKIPNISGNDERGLLGLAFHPDYDQNGYFFVNYINLSNDTVVERYSVSAGNPDVADPGSNKLIITVDQPFSNHNGGDLQFGPDGYLYIGLGDGGSGGDPGDRAQCLDELLGKMLRLDIDTAAGVPYAIPPGNPWADDGDATTLAEIWARGVRNPFRYSFDYVTGDMYIGDVGQNAREEIDFQPAASEGGENYGWRIMEAENCFSNSTCDDPPIPCNDPSLTDPIHSYAHTGNPCDSTTGGFVYRGGLIPSLQGTYFFGDFCRGQIWSFRYDGNNVTEFMERTAELVPNVGVISQVASFGQDGFQELYIVDRGGTTTGEVFKIVSDVADTPDVAVTRPLRVGPAAPNPFSDFMEFRVDFDRGGALEVSVVDAAGRLIRHITSASVDPGSGVYNWDGRNDEGSRVPSGVYFINATLGGTSRSRPVHLLR